MSLQILSINLYSKDLTELVKPETAFKKLRKFVFLKIKEKPNSLGFILPKSSILSKSSISFKCCFMFMINKAFTTSILVQDKKNQWQNIYS